MVGDSTWMYSQFVYPGMILLSELSRRRIRSINKLIRVGRTEIVIVLRVDKDKGPSASSLSLSLFIIIIGIGIVIVIIVVIFIIIIVVIFIIIIVVIVIYRHRRIHRSFQEEGGNGRYCQV